MAMDDLSKEQLIEVLGNLRQRIVDGVPLSGYDCTDIGDKNTECDWGLCTDDRAIWSVPHNKRPRGIYCPLDTHPLPKRYIDSGCFHRCRFFQGRSTRPTREQAIMMYDDAIERYSNMDATYYVWAINDTNDATWGYEYLADTFPTQDIRNAALYHVYENVIAARDLAVASTPLGITRWHIRTVMEDRQQPQPDSD